MRRVHSQDTALSFYFLFFFLLYTYIFAGDISQINSYETWNADPRIIPSTDPAGIGWNSSNGHIYIADSEINEENSWPPNYANIFVTNTTGSVLYDMFRSRPDKGTSSSREPTGICYYPAEDAYFVTNDDRLTLTEYRRNSGVTIQVQEWDLTLSPFSMGDAEGLTVNPVNGHFYLVDGADGGMKVVALQIISGALSYIPSESFSIRPPQHDGEGIAYRPSTGTIFVMSSESGGTIFEWDTDGTLITTYDISGFSPTPLAPQGLTFGPRSTNNSYESLYIADGGLDNNDVGWPACNDGVIYEAKIGVDDTPLPVELTSFSVDNAENGVLLKWTTESELNNIGFEVFRSENKDGDYVLLSSYRDNINLAGQGNSSVSHDYSYFDEMIEPGKTYWYKLTDLDFSGMKTFHEPRSVTIPSATNTPVAIKLYPNYPNPFNPSTNIKFEINRSVADAVETKLVIYNSTGRIIRVLKEGKLSSGIYYVQWDGKNMHGGNVSGGTYFARFSAGLYSQTIKMALIK